MKTNHQRNNRTIYEKDIQSRSMLRYIVGPLSLVKQANKKKYNKMNYLKKLFLILCPMLFIGCTSYKQAVYLRGDDAAAILEQKNTLYEYRVMPKDELTITISTSDPAASVPFYRKIGQDRSQAPNNQGMNNAKLLDYLVDNDGNIDYPVLGKLRVQGLTTRECEAMIRQALLEYLSEEPTVTVRVSNFKVSVLGEVNRPGTYSVQDERINIFQALALAGDMTLFSVRKDVQLLREDSTGRTVTYHLDLTQADITTSPYYYLQQNDIIYVRPTKSKVFSNTFNSNTSMWTSLASLALAILSTCIVVYY